MKTDHERASAIAAETDKLVRAQSEGRDWSSVVDVQEIAVGLGDLREHFATTLLGARGPEEKAAARHHAGRAFARMLACDMVLLRDRRVAAIARISLEHMGMALTRTDSDMLPFAVRMAGVVRDVGMLHGFPEGALGHLSAIARDLLGNERAVDGALRKAFAERAAEALGLAQRRV